MSTMPRNEETATALARYVLVGYTLQPTPGAAELRPDYQAPSHYKDANKIAQYITEKQAAFEEATAMSPYVMTFGEVVLVYPGAEKVVRFDSKDRHPFGDKPPVSGAVAGWLLKNFPGVWSNESARLSPPVRFLGFSPKVFLKIMGLECSMPPVSAPLPLPLWFGTDNYWDIENAIVPSDFAKHLNFAAVLRQRGLKIPEGWTQPFQNARQDLTLATEIAVQLGIAHGQKAG